MAPSASPSDIATTSQDTSPAAHLVLGVTLPLLVISVVVLRSVVVYRKRLQKEKSLHSQNVLTVDVTVDVSKVVDAPYVPYPLPAAKRMHRDVWRTSLGNEEERTSATFEPSATRLGQAHTCASRASGLFDRDSSGSPVQDPQPTVPFAALLATSTSGASTCPLATAFLPLDVEALAESTIRFPRLRPDDDISGYPTIPSILSIPLYSTNITSADISVHESDALDPDDPDDNHEEPASDDSLDTLVDSAAELEQPTSTPDKLDTPQPNHPCAPTLAVGLTVAQDLSSSPAPTFLDPLPTDGIAYRSPLILTSLSPLQLESSPMSVCLSPDIDKSLDTGTPLLDEALPSATERVLSVASFSAIFEEGLRPRTRVGRVLQPLLENLGSSCTPRAHTSHYSISSLKSAFSPMKSTPPPCPVQSPSVGTFLSNPNTPAPPGVSSFSLEQLSREASPAYLSRMCFSPSTSPRTASPAPDSASIPSRPPAPTPDGSLPVLAFPLPPTSIRLSVSPAAHTDPPDSPERGGSPFLRPRAPTPGSIASRFSTTLSLALSDAFLDDAAGFGGGQLRVPVASWEKRRSCDDVHSEWSAGFALSPSSSLVFPRPRAPTPGSAASISPDVHPQATPVALLPPLNLEAISPLSL